MTPSEFLGVMDEMMELPEGTLKPGGILSTYEQWDSLAVVGFIALADRHLHVAVNPGKVAEAETVDDLLKLLGDALQPSSS